MAKKSTTTVKIKARPKAKAKAKASKKDTSSSSKTKKDTSPSIDNYSIRAYAGCGKSTTIEWAEQPENIPKGITPSDQQQAIFEALKDRPEGKGKRRSTRVACFNNSIMEELVPKFPEADVRNNNKIGYHTLIAYLNFKPKWGFIKPNKYQQIAKDLIGNPYDNQKLFPTFTAALKLCDMVRITLTGTPLLNTTFNNDNAQDNALWEVSQDQLIKMSDFYGIDIEDGECLKYVEDLINEGIRNCRSSMDFADQIFLPNVFGCKPPHVGRCYIDEMQDLNAAQHGLLYGSADQFVVVGDVHQSIYGFAGADPTSMPKFEKLVDASLLPLTITRRCPSRHVAHARNYLPSNCDFQAAPGAIDGTIDHVDLSPEFYSSLTGEDNLCLSRTNAPLVMACFRCWKAGIPALIRGRDVAANLASTIKRVKKNTNTEILTVITDDYNERIEKYRKLDKLDLASAKEDELAVLEMFLIETKTPKEAVDSIYKMFDDKAKARAIQFSTIHKAKGLETDNLVILTPDLLPHPGISKIGPFWAAQERNIAYVCYTRGKNRMYINDQS